MNDRRWWTASGVLALCAPLAPALAQEVAAGLGRPQSNEPQQTTSAGTGMNDDGAIVVTARRRAESSQDVPLAVSVIGGEHIDATGSFNVGRLQQLTPTLQFYSSNPRNTAVNIRGLGVPFGLTNDGIEQGVGIYIDDVYNSRVASATFDFLDVAQIEVLRGPQGTLYGKNTTAGAINITTNQPTFAFEGKAEVSLGDYDFRQAKARFRVSAMTAAIVRASPPTPAPRPTRRSKGTACTTSGWASAAMTGLTRLPGSAMRSAKTISNSCLWGQATPG